MERGMTVLLLLFTRHQHSEGSTFDTVLATKSRGKRVASLLLPTNWARCSVADYEYSAFGLFFLAKGNSCLLGMYAVFRFE